MKVLFIRPALSMYENKHPQHVTTSFLVGYSASVLKSSGHDVHFFDLEAGHRFDLNELKKLSPDIVIIESITPNVKFILELCDRIRKYCKYICCFGQHASEMPNTFLYRDSPVDFCIIGEPEQTVLELINSLEKKRDLRNVDGLAFFNKKLIVNKNRELINDLDILPFPSYFFGKSYTRYNPVEGVYKKRFGFILASRGCPYRCTYCSPTLRVSYGKRVRYRSFENVLLEIEYLKSNGINLIFFIDDLITFDRKWMMNLCKGIIDRGIDLKWVVQTRIELIDDEMLKLMKKAGCTTFCVGIESGNDSVLKRLKKDITVDKIKKSFRMLKKNGFLVSAYFLLGCPDETKEEIQDTFKLIKELKPDMIQIAFVTPYPGSELFQNTLPLDFDKYSHYNAIAFNPSKVKTEDLIAMQKRFYKEFYFNPRFLARYLFYLIPGLIFNTKQEIGLMRLGISFMFKKTKR